MVEIFGVPCHAWNFNFFEMLVNRVGKYVCSDENTLKSDNMDVARFMVRKNCVKVLNETLLVRIDDELFSISTLEDTHGSLRNNMNCNGNLSFDRDSSSSN